VIRLENSGCSLRSASQQHAWRLRLGTVEFANHLVEGEIEDYQLTRSIRADVDADLPGTTVCEALTASCNAADASWRAPDSAASDSTTLDHNVVADVVSVRCWSSASVFGRIAAQDRGARLESMKLHLVSRTRTTSCC